MPQWRRVAQATDIKENRPLVIELDDEESVLLTRVEGRVVACANMCPHYGGPLGDGVLRGGRVVCPYHNATFHLASGELDRPPAMDDLPTYEVKEENGGVFLGERTDPQIAMPTGSDDRQVLIVGAGAAGSSCAETLRKEGYAGQITMITRETEGPYDRPMLSKGLLSGDAPAKYLPLRPNSFYESLGITLVTEAEVTRVDPTANEVETSSGDRLRGDFIVLATGGVPRRLDVPGADLEGVFTLRSHADAEAIAASCGEESRVAVIGASFIGMEVAAQLRQRGLEVSVIEPEPQPMYTVLGPDVGAWLRTVHEAEGVGFHLGHRPESITGNGRVSGVRLDDGSTVAADLVVMGVGVDPRVEYLADSDLVEADVSSGVRVDERLATSAAGVFAAGDIAVYPGWNGLYRVEHWVHAQEQGRHVARAILGETAPYRRVPFFWTRQYGTGVKYVGFPEAHDHIQYDGVPGDGEFIAGFFAADRLVAAAAVGKANKFAKLAELLEQGERLDRQRFLEVRNATEDEP